MWFCDWPRDPARHKARSGILSIIAPLQSVPFLPVKGAIGLTHEHSLHRLTRRLWSWRDEFGNESHWSRELGRR
jgi:hypothetical protein